MRNWLICLALFLVGFLAHAQNTIHFTQYAINPSYFNPSWVGTQDQAEVFLQHRTQWLGYTTSFDGAGSNPNTQMITTIVPVRNFFISAVGLNVVNDVIKPRTSGKITNSQIQIPLSVPFYVGSGVINVGVAPGFISQSQSTEYRFTDSGDPNIPEAGVFQAKMNLSAGITFQSVKNWFLGLGATNLLQPNLDFNMGIQNQQIITPFIHAGLKMEISEDIGFQPSVIVRSDLTSYSFDIGGIISINEKIWGGLSYRNEESVNFLFGYGLSSVSRLKINYSFDLIIQNRESKALTSHELLLSYSLPELVIGGRKAIKTPRFTY